MAYRYQEAFDGIAEAAIFTEPENCQSNYWLNALLLTKDNINKRNDILNQTNEAGLQTRPAWVPMHQLKMFEPAAKMDLSITENLHRRIITLPSSPRLADNEFGYMKFCVVTGSRAEYGLLYWLMRGIADDPAMELQLIVEMHLEERFGNTVQMIEQDGFSISARVPMNIYDDSGATIAKSLVAALLAWLKRWRN